MDGMKEKVKEALKDNWYSGKSIDESADAILSLFEKKCVWKQKEEWGAYFTGCGAYIARKEDGLDFCSKCGHEIEVKRPITHNSPYFADAFEEDKEFCKWKQTEKDSDYYSTICYGIYLVEHKTKIPKICPSCSKPIKMEVER